MFLTLFELISEQW